jgi:hypothetical protein
VLLTTVLPGSMNLTQVPPRFGSLAVEEKDSKIYYTYRSDDDEPGVTSILFNGDKLTEVDWGIVDQDFLQETLFEPLQSQEPAVQEEGKRHMRHILQAFIFPELIEQLPKDFKGHPFMPLLIRLNDFLFQQFEDGRRGPVKMNLEEVGEQSVKFSVDAF